jgi:hypothetical protein
MHLRLSHILLLPFMLVLFQVGAKADDVVVPAGTLIHCTLDEPNLSSATADVGDPVICHLSTVQEFGHVVFPRGSYLGGHVESFKEPGHFFGKGNLKITFDRIGLPTTDIPVPSKVIAASGYRVDRKGDILGKGHAKRDVIEWLFPPLWPWKVIMLPARGPRPTLKGEEQVTLRLMDDVVVPRIASAYPSSDRPPSARRPASFQPSDSPTRVDRASYAPSTSTGNEDQQTNLVATSDPQPVVASNRSADNRPVRVSFIALKSGEVYGVARYQVNGGSLTYELPSGTRGSIDLPEIDWKQTAHLNSEGGSAAMGQP